jgi:membrane-bound lytic murein transglycosylase A
LSRPTARVERLAALLLLAALIGCAQKAEPPAAIPPPPPPPAPVPPAFTPVPFRVIAFTDIPGWREDRMAEALPALRKSCAALLKMPDDRAVGQLALYGKAGEWNAACRALPQAGGDDAVRTYLEKAFRPAYLPDAPDDGLFTGYYEPIARGSKTKTGKFTAPLYRKPPGSVTADRAAIDRGALAGKGLELVWLDDAIDAYFLQVQGSGTVMLDGGGQMRVGYAGDNGKTYVAIGRLLVERGALKPEDVSLQSIRDWLRRNPREAPAVMQANPRYIFFRAQDGMEGPLGSGGVALTPGRSLAVDPAHIAMHVPLWVDVSEPGSAGPGSAGPGASERRIRRVMVAQDTGSAIKGPMRGDFFWGHGPEAEVKAGPMKERGSILLLLPESVAARLAPRS